jgi:MFS family permease
LSAEGSSIGAMLTEVRALREIFRSPDLRRLQLAWLATQAALWGATLVLVVYAYGKGGAGAVGLMALFRTLPGAPTAPFLALLGDRRSRRSVLLATTAVLGIALAATALAVEADAPIGVVYALAAVLAVASTATEPAHAGLLPLAARTPSELASSNVATSLMRNIGFLIGSLGGGVLLNQLSSGPVLGILAGVYGLALYPLARLSIQERPEMHVDEDARPAHQVLEGFRTVGSSPQLRLLIGIMGTLSLVEGATDVLVVVAALGFLDGGDAGAGYLWAAWGVGAIVGGASVLGLLSRAQLTIAFLVGAIVMGTSTAVLGGLSSMVLAALALAATGAGFALVEIAVNTFLQRLAPDHVMSRVYGVLEVTYVVAVAVGSVAAGALADAVGARVSLLIVGAVLPIAVILRRSSLARFEAGAPVAEREYGLLRRNGIFAPLPVATTERLARSLVEVRAAKGEVVIREGEVGDRFYVIADGELDAFEGEVYRRTMGSGDCFGEIALLRDVPRTATVRARSDAVLVALDRDPFIEAVTGLAQSRKAASALAEERLAPDPGS